MKRICILAVLLLAGIAASAQNSGKALYQKFSDEPGIQAVYISSAMFRLIGKIPDVELGDSDVNLARVIKSMNGFYLLSSEDPAVGGQLARDVTQFIGKSDFELLMEAKEEGETMRMYTVSPDEATITSLVMLSRDNDETTFLSIDGVIDRAALEELIASAAAE